MSFLTSLKVAGTDLKRVSVIVLILMNLLPIFGVLLMGWQVFSILFLFWSENLIIGLFNVIKMILASSDNKLRWGAKASAILFFCVHYGLFTMVHGLFITVMFGGFLVSDDPLLGLSDTVGTVFSANLGWAVLALAVSHAVSLVINYIGKGEYKSTSLNQLMMQPYGRVVILHMTIIIGGILVTIIGAPVVSLVLLIALKTFIDIKAHLKQHSFLGVDKPDPVGNS